MDAPDARWPENVSIVLKGSGDAIEPDPSNRGALIRNGTYEACMRKEQTLGSGPGPVMTELLFEPVEITDASPERIVFRLRGGARVQGTVVDAVSGRPTGGAFVLAVCSLLEGHIEDLTPAEWAALEALPVNPPIEDPALEPLRKAYGFDLFARADGAGVYALGIPRGRRIHSLAVFTRDSLISTCLIGQSEPEAGGTIPVRPIPLFPAATVGVQVANEGEAGSFTVSSSPEGTPPDWAGLLVGEVDFDPQQLSVGGNWHSFNKPQRCRVPAGYPLALALQFSNPRMADSPLGAGYNLTRGQYLDFGEVTPGAALQILVRVTGDDGQPIEGVPVRKLTGDTWSLPANTAVDGVAVLYADPHEKGEIGVLAQEGPDLVVTTVPYDLAVPDAPTAYEIVLSAEDLARIFAPH